MSRKVINQSDLRRMMKERTEGLGKNEKIESPLAKYDSSGRLTCVACCMEITSKMPWRHHILTRSHKENVNKRLKRKQNDPSSSACTSSANEKDVLPSIANDSPATDSKRSKHETENAALIQGYSSSSEDEEVVIVTSRELDGSHKTPNTTSVLPSDFFDAPPKNNTESAPPNKEQKATTSLKAGTPNILPEGFFDDPVLDAKARKVEYKDPKEEEWEKFKKIIAEETTVSQSIIDDDAEESEVNKVIDQIDEQIYQLKKVNQLLTKREAMLRNVRNVKVTPPPENTGAPSAEEFEGDIDSFLDWRAKDLWDKPL